MSEQISGDHIAPARAKGHARPRPELRPPPSPTRANRADELRTAGPLRVRRRGWPASSACETSLLQPVVEPSRNRNMFPPNPGCAKGSAPVLALPENGQPALLRAVDSRRRAHRRLRSRSDSVAVESMAPKMPASRRSVSKISSQCGSVGLLCLLFSINYLSRRHIALPQTPVHPPIAKVSRGQPGSKARSRNRSRHPCPARCNAGCAAVTHGHAANNGCSRPQCWSQSCRPSLF